MTFQSLFHMTTGSAIGLAVLAIARSGIGPPILRALLRFLIAGVGYREDIPGILVIWARSAAGTDPLHHHRGAATDLLVLCRESCGAHLTIGGDFTERS